MDDEKEANYSFLLIFMKNKLLIGGFIRLSTIVTVNYVERYSPSILSHHKYSYQSVLNENGLVWIFMVDLQEQNN